MTAILKGLMLIIIIMIVIIEGAYIIEKLMGFREKLTNIVKGLVDKHNKFDMYLKPFAYVIAFYLSIREPIAKIILGILLISVVLVLPIVIIPIILFIIKQGLIIGQAIFTEEQIVAYIIGDTIQLETFIWVYVTLIGAIAATTLGIIMYRLTKSIDMKNFMYNLDKDIKDEDKRE